MAILASILAQWVLVSFFFMEGNTFAVNTEATATVQECNDKSSQRKLYKYIKTYAVTTVVSRCFRVNQQYDDNQSHVLVLFLNGEVMASGYSTAQSCSEDRLFLVQRYEEEDKVNVWARCDKLRIGHVEGDRIPTRRQLIEAQALKGDLGI